MERNFKMTNEHKKCFVLADEKAGYGRFKLIGFDIAINPESQKIKAMIGELKKEGREIETHGVLDHNSIWLFDKETRERAIAAVKKKSRSINVDIYDKAERYFEALAMNLISATVDFLKMKYHPYHVTWFHKSEFDKLFNYVLGEGIL